MTVRRGRGARALGYRFENALVRRLGTIPRVQAIRIGAPSASLPDIVAWSKERDTTIVFECKATSVPSRPIRVPRRQIDTLERWRLGPLYGRAAAFSFIACRWPSPRAYSGMSFVPTDTMEAIDEYVTIYPHGPIAGVRRATGDGVRAQPWERIWELLCP